MEIRSLPAKGHLPSLDGLRAISIALVLIGHLSGTRGFKSINLGVGDYAHLGVLVFFVISGFLITLLLLSEHAKSGRVSLKLFYSRRALRLLPASYTYIACISILWIAGIIHIEAKDLLHAATYTVDWLRHPSWQIGHLWSLSVEEQFYLFWPVAFVITGPRRALWAAAGMMLLGPAARSIAWMVVGWPAYRDLNMFPLVADSLATGCVLAMLKGQLEQVRWYLALFRPVNSALLLFFILLMNRFTAYTVFWIFGTSVINGGIAVLIHRCVYGPHDWIGDILNWRPIAFAGLLSYSLYLWQQPFLNRNSTAWVNAFPQNLALSVAAALASYFMLEKPLLELRQRLRG